MKDLKKILVLSLTALIILSAGSSTFGALHAPSRFNVDTWYTIDPDPPLFQVMYDREDFSYPAYTIQGDYFLNDQTFVYGVYGDDDDASMTMTMLAGSYLFDSGFFAGLAYMSIEASGSDGSFTIISPGYRWNLADEHNYVAFSLDYLITDTPLEDESQLDSADLDLHYFTDTYRFDAEIMAWEDDYTDGDFSAAFKASDQLTYGGELYVVGEGGNGSMGLTYTMDWLILDARISKDFAATPFCLDLGFLFQVTDGFHLGFDAYRT
jgi:hypothetical protein